MISDGRCPRCRRRILQVGEDGRIKIRTTMLAFRSDGRDGRVVCRCGEDVPLGLDLPHEALSGARPRLIVGAIKKP